MSEETVLIPPVKVGDIIKDQEVINNGQKNDGVVKYEGYILFVTGCQKGQVVDVKVTRVLSKFGFGTVLEE
jgi:predicted RNA-binding protein with TRAM domain